MKPKINHKRLFINLNVHLLKEYTIQNPSYKFIDSSLRNSFQISDLK